ncbi:MAG: mono/diheme cytochrome c family protein [Acidimicrobiales bacterium]|jgi:mono/diheme cytochrome c family protein
MTMTPTWLPVGLAFALLALGGCAGNATGAPEVANGDPVLIEGRDLYIRTCAQCHGPAGGGGRGLPLNEGRVVEKYPQIEDQIAVVAEGRNNMPAFAGRFTDSQIGAVVRYTREILSDEQALSN